MNPKIFALFPRFDKTGGADGGRDPGTPNGSRTG